MQTVSTQTQINVPQSFVQLFIWQHNPNITHGSTSLQTVKAISFEEWKQIDFRCQSGFTRPSVFTFPANHNNWSNKLKQIWQLIEKSDDLNSAKSMQFCGCYSIYIALPLMEP